jgi:hypothetical protein
MKLYLIAILSVLWPAIGLAAYTDGNQLYRWLLEDKKESGSAFESGLFHGYVAGVVDAGANKWFCISPGVNRRQMSDIVKNGLENDPGSRHLEAHLLVIFYLARAFPCQEQEFEGED